MNEFDSDEEIISPDYNEEDDSESSNCVDLIIEDIDISEISKLKTMIFHYNVYIWQQDLQSFSINSSRFTFIIPTKFLPLTLQSVSGFTVSDVLLNITVELNDFRWDKLPRYIDVKHPIYGKAYVGSTLVNETIKNFFSPFYKPQKSYRSATYLITPPGEANLKYLKILESEGYDIDVCRNLLITCNNDFNKTKELISTGLELTNQVPISYKECPIIYLLLEISESFLDLSNHCCICRSKLFESGIKPTACNKELCQFSICELGIGNRIYQELVRDPDAADLLITTFAAAMETNYLNPSPPMFNQSESIEILKSLPSVQNMIDQCSNDNELNSFLGLNSISLLKWIILSNRSQLIKLDLNLCLPEFPNTIQFMSLLSSPEKEDKFRKLKQQYGSMFLFHGSTLDRWHSIIRNGLINATGTKYLQNGSALGPGIYFARSSSTSIGYSRSGENKYKNSKFPKNTSIISLCEVAKVPELKDHGWAHTLTNENAVIVRFIFVDLQVTLDTISNPIKKIPTLKEVLLQNIKK